MKELLKSLFLFILGGIMYMGVEILYRGHSHWTMFIVGGLCFFLIGLINEFFPWDMPLTIQCLIGAFTVTIIEFISGILINIVFNMHVWDYSNLPFNILGQICLPFSLIWYFLSALAIFLDDYLRWKLFDEDKPHYKLL